MLSAKLPYFLPLNTAPDPDAVQQELSIEVSGAEYLFSRNWFEEILTYILKPLKSLQLASASTSGIIAVIVGVLLVAGLVWWAVRTWRPREKKQTGDAEELLIDPKISPQEYRDRALALRETDPDEAVKNAFRCAIAILDRAEIIPVTPGRTAGEMGQLMRRQFPDLGETINASSLAFNTAAYATTPAPRVSPNDVNTVLILADALRTRVQANASAANITPVNVPSPQWEVQL